MIEMKLIVNIGLKIVFGSFVSGTLAAMLRWSPPGNDALMVSWSETYNLCFRASHEHRLLTCEPEWTFCGPADLSSQYSLGHHLQCHHTLHYSNKYDH